MQKIIYNKLNRTVHVYDMDKLIFSYKNILKVEIEFFNIYSVYEDIKNTGDLNKNGRLLLRLPVSNTNMEIIY